MEDMQDAFSCNDTSTWFTKLSKRLLRRLFAFTCPSFERDETRTPDEHAAPGGVGRRLTRQERVDTIYTLVPPSARTDPPDDRPPFLSRRTPKTHRLRPRVPRALKASWAAAKAWRTNVYNEPSTKPWRSNAVSAQP